MLENLVKRLQDELEMDESVQLSNEGAYTLFFDENIEIRVEQIANNFLLTGNIAPCPTKSKQALFAKIMEANLFGRGTRNNSIGLNAEGSQLMLTAELDQNTSYKLFKEKLEDFVTIIDFWRNEAYRHQ